jgi:hypothetical protein
MKRKTQRKKEFDKVNANEEFATRNRSAPTRPLSGPRRSLDLAVAIRRQTPEQQRQFSAALDGFLTEMVRQHLDPQRSS